MTREVNYFKKDPCGTWAAAAACKGSYGTHFPDAPKNTPEHAAQVARAKSVCASCPVKDPCFALAVRNNEKDGVWGGEEFPNGARAYRKRLRRDQQTGDSK